MKQEEHPTEKVPGPTLRKVAEKLYQYSAARVRYYARFRHKGERIIQALGTRNDPCTSLLEAKRLLREHRNKLDRLERLAGERNCGRKKMDEIARWMDHGNGQHSVANGNGSV